MLLRNNTWNRSPEEWFLSISTHNDFGLVVENTPLLLFSYNKYNIIKLLIIGNSQNISCNYYKILFEAVIFTRVISHCSKLINFINSTGTNCSENFIYNDNLETSAHPLPANSFTEKSLDKKPDALKRQK